MGTKRKTCPWHKRGKLWVVHPGWNNRVELTFTEQALMVAWAHGNKVVLKDTGRRDDAYA